MVYSVTKMYHIAFIFIDLQSNKNIPIFNFFFIWEDNGPNWKSSRRGPDMTSSKSTIKYIYSSMPSLKIINKEHNSNFRIEQYNNYTKLTKLKQCSIKHSNGYFIQATGWDVYDIIYLKFIFEKSNQNVLFKSRDNRNNYNIIFL